MIPSPPTNPSSTNSTNMNNIRVSPKSWKSRFQQNFNNIPAERIQSYILIMYTIITILLFADRFIGYSRLISLIEESYDLGGVQNGTTSSSSTKTPSIIHRSHYEFDKQHVFTDILMLLTPLSVLYYMSDQPATRAVIKFVNCII